MGDHLWVLPAWVLVVEGKNRYNLIKNEITFWIGECFFFFLVPISFASE